MRTLSIIILSYNTEHITRDCVDSLILSLSPYTDLHFEIIIIDNASTDGSPLMLSRLQKNKSIANITIKVVLNKVNEGFPQGNNRGVSESSGTYLLFLNSDVLVGSVDWREILEYMEKNPQVGVLTLRVNLPSGNIDPASHRGFPTLWNSFCYFSGLEKMTQFSPSLSAIFGGYHLTQYALDKPHEIDSCTGAFYLTRRNLFNEIGGFDKEYFMYGEDIDLSYRIKQLGHHILFFPKYSVLHLKHQSGLSKKKTAVQSETKAHFYRAMKIFYRKHYAVYHSSLINRAVYSLIDLKSKF